MDKNAEGITETGPISLCRRGAVFVIITTYYGKLWGFVSAPAMYFMYVLAVRQRLVAIFTGGREELHMSAGTVCPH